MKTVFALLALAGIASAQTAPTSNPFAGPWSGAEFIQRGHTATIVLNEVKSCAPLSKGINVLGIPLGATDKLTLGFDLFAGYDTISNDGVAGFAGVARWHFNPSFSVFAGVGQKADLSKQFQLNQLSAVNAGVIIGASWGF